MYVCVVTKYMETGSQRLHGRLLCLNYGVNVSTFCSLCINLLPSCRKLMIF